MAKDELTKRGRFTEELLIAMQKEYKAKPEPRLSCAGTVLSGT
jgi:hypothetical protein